MALFNSRHDQHLTIKGFVLYGTIEIERKMDRFLSRYFCSDFIKQNEFANLILFNERVTFELKKAVFFAILEKDGYKYFIKENPHFKSALDEIPTHRNRFAHLEDVKDEQLALFIRNKTEVIDAMDKNNKKRILVDQQTIVYKRFSNGKLQHLGYSMDGIILLENKIHSLMDLLDELLYVEPEANEFI